MLLPGYYVTSLQPRVLKVTSDPGLMVETSRKRSCSIAPEGWSSEEEEEDKENNAGKQKKRLRLSLRKKLADKKSERFKATSPKSLSMLSRHNPPANTKASTNWAVHNFHEWFEWHNSNTESETCPDEVLLPSCSSETLGKWLPVYVTETRNKAGQPYPPKTVYSLLSGILRHMTIQNPNYPNFLQKNSVPFVDFHRCLDNFFCKLREDGIGAESKHTPSISTEEENSLWDKQILNTCTPRGLLNAVFYYNGKNFVLHGGQEHRDLKLSMLTRLKDPDRYVYVENSSKNRGGGLGQLRLEHKKVPVYSCPSAGERCHVRLLDMCISHLPPAAKEQDIFYCQPLSNFAETGVWYCGRPCGKNTQSKMVPEMFKEAGIEERKTNHSLKAAGVSQLYEAGVDEKIIQARSGHRRLESMRSYERVTEVQEQAVYLMYFLPQKMWTFVQSSRS